MTAKYRVSLLLESEVKTIVAMLKNARIPVTQDKEAGIVKAKLPDTADLIFWAIRKGNKDQPWICRSNLNYFTFEN